jgi:ABC-type glycerol-3-phosphate transport system permease component
MPYADQFRQVGLAGAEVVRSIVPILIVYLLLQRSIIRGVMLTGMAGR